MNWALIVVRNNVVEQFKIFRDFWVGAEYADNYIKNIDPNFHNNRNNLPEYHRNEYYKNGDLTIGLYRHID